jgi:hypothetical protein
MTKAKTLLDEGIKEFPDSGFLSYFVKEEYKKAESKN